MQQIVHRDFKLFICIKLTVESRHGSNVRKNAQEMHEWAMLMNRDATQSSLTVFRVRSSIRGWSWSSSSTRRSLCLKRKEDRESSRSSRLGLPYLTISLYHCLSTLMNSVYYPVMRFIAFNSCIPVRYFVRTSYGLPFVILNCRL